MKSLAILLKLMHVYTHAAHNLCGRVVFFQDHDFFGEVYPALLTSYDSVVERIIGLSGESAISFKEIEAEVASKLATLPLEGVKENSTFYSTLLQMEEALCQTIAQLVPSVSPGTEQLIGTLCDESEIRQYKIKQRLKK